MKTYKITIRDYTVSENCKPIVLTLKVEADESNFKIIRKILHEKYPFPRYTIEILSEEKTYIAVD